MQVIVQEKKRNRADADDARAEGFDREALKDAPQRAEEIEHEERRRNERSAEEAPRARFQLD